MNKRFFPIFAGLVILVASALPLSGIELEVDYLEGFLEYREGRDTWVTLDLGDTIPDGGTVRLSDRGFAELSTGARTVTLTKDGIYNTSDLIGDEPEKANFRQVIGSKFSALLNRSSGSDGMTVAAVRGAEAEGDDFISWEDETTDYLMDGTSLFDEGDVVGARNLFEEGTIWESGAIQRECSFRLGVCQQILGDPRAARQTFASIRPEADDPYLAEYAIVTATLYIESMDYSQADAVLATYLDAQPRGEAAQAAWLLSAYSLEGQGKSSAQQNSLQNAVNLGPRTEIGLAATAMMQ